MPRKPKHGLTDLIAAQMRFNARAHLTDTDRDVLNWCVEWHIKQRTASKGNPGRPARPKQPKGEA